MISSRKPHHVSNFSIGTTIVGIGTYMPEYVGCDDFKLIYATFLIFTVSIS